MKKSENSINNLAVRRLISRGVLGVRAKNLARAEKSRNSRNFSKSFAQNSANSINSANSKNNFNNFNDFAPNFANSNRQNFNKNLNKNSGKNPDKNSPKKSQNSRKISAKKSKIKNVFLPNRENNYRPKLVRRAGLILTAILLLVLNFGYLYLQNQQILGDKTDINSENLLAATNSAREKNGEKPLAQNPELEKAAQNKAADMLAKNYWAHNSPENATPWDFISATGYNYIDAGENLARGFASSDAILTAWLASPSHRANVLDEDFLEVGFAAVEGKMDGRATILVVAEYGRPKIAGAPNGSGAEFAANSSPENLVKNGEIIGAKTSVGEIENSNFLSRFLNGIHNFAPSLIFTLVALTVVALTILVAHFAHWKLSPRLAKTWKIHHALIKICFVAILALGAILSYGGGVI